MECRYPIRGGLLVARPGGSLLVAQRPGVELELFVAGYFPRLGGTASRRSLRRGLYTALQARAHRARRTEVLRDRPPRGGRVRAVVFGASGVIGRAVLPELARRAEVVAVSRTSRDPQDGVVWASADATDPAAVDGVLRRDDVVVYLVHSLGTEDFEEIDRRAADTVAAAAARAGARQIVYLGGLGATGTRSRRISGAARRPPNGCPRARCP